MSSLQPTLDMVHNIATDPLWQRIQVYSFDHEGAELSFTVRLMQENGWSRSKSLQAIEEYRRFLYLACRAGHSVTPSDEVDQVWHLHLQYTREYWNRFCPDVLGQPLHHDPTNGGRMEDDKFENWYECTLASYRRLFRENPPLDIWPKAICRFGDAPYFRRINTRGLWVAPKAQAISLGAGLVLGTTAISAAANDGFGVGGWATILVVMGAVVFLVVRLSGLMQKSRQKKSDSGSGCGGGCAGGGGKGGACSSGCGGGGCGGGGCGGG